MIENEKEQNRPATLIPPLAGIEQQKEDEEELEEWQVTGRRSMSVEDMATDMVATPAHKRTKVANKTQLAKWRRNSPPECRREAEDDKFFMPPLPPPPAVRITDSSSPGNVHKYCINYNQVGYMKIICPFYVKKTCRNCGQPGHNFITCGSPYDKTVPPRNLKPLPENTSTTPGPSNLRLIQERK